MAKDLLLGHRARDWGRGHQDDGSGGKVVVVQGGFPWLGAAVFLTAATKIFTGKWPWYWFQDQKNR